ncbi:hypothetical protein SprV_0200807000 [Sparganum proliferum]
MRTNNVRTNPPPVFLALFRHRARVVRKEGVCQTSSLPGSSVVFEKYHSLVLLISFLLLILPFLLLCTTTTAAATTTITINNHNNIAVAIIKIIIIVAPADPIIIGYSSTH